MEEGKESISFEGLSTVDYDRINAELAGLDTLDVIKWAYQTFQERIVYACSFGAESMVLIDLITKVRPNAKLLFLDTQFHFKETYQLIEEVKKRYPLLQIMSIEPLLSVEEQEKEWGKYLWERDPDKCCQIRKILPLQQALKEDLAWISGLRREQSPTRVKTQYVNQDNKFQSIKICPLIHWSWEDIWAYIHAFDLPYNPLHDQGYPSIGCEYCTFAVENGADSRAGRWVNKEKTECGLHI